MDQLESINSTSINLLIDNKYFITFFVTIFVIYFLPLKHKDIHKNKVSFAMGIKFISDLVLFLLVVFIITIVLSKVFLAKVISKFDEDCQVQVGIFKWFFTFYKGHYEGCSYNVKYVEKGIQNIVWMALVLKGIHSIENVVLPLIEPKIKSKKFMSLLYISVYLVYFIFFCFLLLKYWRNSDSLWVNLIYNTCILYSLLTFITLMVDKIIIISNRGVLNNPVSYKYVKNHLPVTLNSNDQLIPDMKYIITINLFSVVAIFFKKYYDINNDTNS